MKRKIRVPFLIVNPKAYIYGQESLELAKVCDELAEQYDIDIIFTAQHVDIRMVAEATKHIIVTAQHLDGIVPGRGMGHILPEGVKDAGAQAVVLNHAEHPLTVDQLDKAIKRANELDLVTIVCCDSPEAANKFAAAKGGAVPINTGKHVYKNWTQIMEKRGAYHPLMDPFKMEANKDIIPDYREDMCPKTLDILSRTVYVGLSPDMDDERVEAIIKECREIAERM